MKVTIPKGSILVLPKRNTGVEGFRSLQDIRINLKDFDMYLTWDDYKNGIKSKFSIGGKNA